MANFSKTWWGKLFIEGLESFTDLNRLGRGRSYARNGKIKDYKINPQNTAYIGDTMGDFIASKKNNIKFIFAGWGYGKYVEDADLHLTDIREML